MKISAKKSSVFICLFVFLILFGCAKKPEPQNVLRSMAKLDQVYIPALIFTNLHKQRESELALERLRGEWDRFNKKYVNLKIKYGLNITDKFWKEDFYVIEGLMTTAESYVREGKLAEAHGQLKGVRMVLRGLRRRNGLEYYLDGMSEFHEYMEEIIFYLRGKDRFTDKDMDNLRSLFKKAQASWAKVSRSEPEAELFGFDQEKVDAVKKRVREEERVLAVFAAALSSQDADRIFQAAQDLKPNFVVLYKAFGDFQPVFDRVVKERREKGEKEDETGSE